MNALDAHPVPFRGRRRWIASPALCLYQGFRRNPRLALSLAPRLTLNRKSWRRFSLNIHGKDFLRDFYDSSLEAGIRPFLMWGTLLGYARDGKLLDHDQDIDLAILASDFARRDALIAAMEGRGHRVRRVQRYKLSFWRKDGILHLDVDVMFRWNGDTISASADGDGPVTAHRFPAGAFDRLNEVTFLDDLSVLVPEAPETVLEAIYGDWRTPVTDYDSRRGPRNRFTLPSFAGLADA